MNLDLHVLNRRNLAPNLPIFPKVIILLVMTDFVAAACNVDITFAKPLRIHNHILMKQLKPQLGATVKPLFSVCPRINHKIR
jgi:hypothetical protein